LHFIINNLLLDQGEVANNQGFVKSHSTLQL